MGGRDKTYVFDKNRHRIKTSLPLLGGEIVRPHSDVTVVVVWRINFAFQLSTKERDQRRGRATFQPTQGLIPPAFERFIPPEFECLKSQFVSEDKVDAFANPEAAAAAAVAVLLETPDVVCICKAVG